MRKIFHRVFETLVVLSLFLACAPKSAENVLLATSPPLSRVDMRPEQVSPGLKVWYQVSFQPRHLDEMRAPEKFKSKAVSGKPISKLDHAFGTGEVFESGENKKVGVLLEGLLKFDQKGVYRLKVLSNDGVRVFLKDYLILNDPDVHADSWDLSGPISVDEPGWYPLRVQYFQRKNTSTLRLFWQSPDSEVFEVIPAEAYGH